MKKVTNTKMDINHIKQKFIEEAETLLTKLDNVLIVLEKDNDNQHVNEIFRIIHTIKGSSGMFGLEKVVEITHEIESLYDIIRNDNLQVPPSLLELTFTLSDHIRALLTDELLAKENNLKRHNLIQENILLVKNSICDIPENEPIAAETNTNTQGLCTWNIIFYPDDELIKRSVNMSYTFQDLFALGTYYISNHPFTLANEQFWSILLVTQQPYEEIENALMFVTDYCKITKIANFDIFTPDSLEKRDKSLKSTTTDFKTELDETPEPHQIKTTETIKDFQINLNELKENTPVQYSKTKTTRIYVEASKLDELMYLVSELVTTKSELTLALQKDNILKAIDSAEKIEKLSKLFSENALDIRLVSLSEMLNKFKRLIRDLAKQLEKDVEFTINGEDTELDKNIIDIIDEPIMHLLRNCIDHGIETPDMREKNGKSKTGTINFRAEKSGNFVFITISDDGKGIDTEYIYNKAIEKGIIQPGIALNEKEIFDLIFLPGFSTAETLSNVSGRGVGMDIVLKKIQSIRGEISISSVKGKGSSFIIKLQQTISIIETLLVKADNLTYAIPVEDIESCILEARENITNRQSNLIEFNNELIPYFNLRNQIKNTSFPGENEKLIIVKRQDKRYAIIADEIIGEFQAVIKPLGSAFSKVRFLSGASLLGDGSIALLIDTDKLWYETAINQPVN